MTHAASLLRGAHSRLLAQNLRGCVEVGTAGSAVERNALPARYG